MKIIKECSSKLGFPYIAYIPENISEKPPIIFHLHGKGERGDGTNLDAVLKNGLPNVANDETLSGAVLVMPQCPIDSFWVAKIGEIKSFIENCVSYFNADKNYVYLCGLSMGGYGTWYTAMAYPKMFRAIAPCCGGGMPWNAEVLDMPIWAFHGDSDETVSPDETIRMVEALKKLNKNVKMTIFENTGHNSWNKAFTPRLIEWLLNN